MGKKKKLRRTIKELIILTDFLDEKVAELERRVEDLETAPRPLAYPPFASRGNFNPAPPYSITFNGPSGPMPDEPPFTLVPSK